MIITRTPVRIPLGGGGTDLPSYASKYGGFLLSAAIDKYVFITVNQRKLDKKIRVSYSKTEIVDHIAELHHDLVREALKTNHLEGGLEITSIADVPAYSGLGTSGSFAVGLLHALHTLRRDHISTYSLAEEACKIEIEYLKRPVGKHDQYLAAFGGISCLEIQKDGGVNVRPAKISAEVVDELERNLLLFYTGIGRKSQDILEEQNRKSHEEDAKVIESLHHIKALGQTILTTLEKGKIREFGEILHEHWMIKKQLSQKISDSQMDKWYALARENGALGGKIMGAGGGGFFMFYCENGKDRLREVMAKEGLIEMRFRFDFEGCKVLVNF